MRRRSFIAALVSLVASHPAYSAIGSIFTGYGTRLRGTGLYAPSELSVMWLPYNWAGDATKRGVIYGHAGGQTVDYCTDPELTAGYGQFAIIRAIVQAGYPVIIAELGGLTPFGNSTAQARMANARTYLQGGSVGAKAGTVLCVGTSMGGLNALAYAGNGNVANVAAIAGVCPVADIQDIVTNNRGGLTATINTAYGGAYTDLVFGATCNPAVMAGTGNYGSLPVKLWYGSTDAICIPSTITGLVASIGASASAVQVTGGHAEATFAAVPPSDVVAFLDAHQ